ncbi:unnamed protein product, partial [Ascophyllum nodosum]
PEQANAEPANVTAQEGPAKQPNIDSTGVVAEKGTPSKPPRMESVLVGKTIPPDEADFDGGVEYSVERAR